MSHHIAETPAEEDPDLLEEVAELPEDDAELTEHERELLSAWDRACTPTQEEVEHFQARLCAALWAAKDHEPDARRRVAAVDAALRTGKSLL